MLASVTSSTPGSSAADRTPIAPTGWAFKLQEMPRASAPPGLFDSIIRESEGRESNDPTPRARSPGTELRLHSNGGSQGSKDSEWSVRQTRLPFSRLSVSQTTQGGNASDRSDEDTEGCGAGRDIDINVALQQMERIQGQIFIPERSNILSSSFEEEEDGDEGRGEVDTTPPPAKRVRYP
ncbi:hypothetical protein EV182_004069 [Spiromyces aspiralis]|uniref:Uncharacterized protein n=1 Tax=Spiromyces aspiralis TaxID=68401 RepID=A0ACC1HQ54_9FUNG|nr:hypothetical protein EV182_004069 [Spiromyces aspiralis]